MYDCGLVGIAYLFVFNRFLSYADITNNTPIDMQLELDQPSQEAATTHPSPGIHLAVAQLCISHGDLAAAVAALSKLPPAVQHSPSLVRPRLTPDHTP